MTDKQIKQIEAQLPAGEKLSRMYTAYEGGIRVISREREADFRRSLLARAPLLADYTDLAGKAGVEEWASFTYSCVPDILEPEAGRSVLAYLVASVGVNAVVEMVVAAVVTGAAGVALKKARLI